jgi:hypothetical protein
MALQQPLLAADTLVGEAFPESYVKVEFVRTPAPDNLVWVNWYANGTARADYKQPVKTREFAISATDIQPFVQAGDHIHAPFYRWLKTLPEFANAIDVLVTPEPSVVAPPAPDMTAPPMPADALLN